MVPDPNSGGLRIGEGKAAPGRVGRLGRLWLWAGPAATIPIRIPCRRAVVGWIQDSPRQQDGHEQDSHEHQRLHRRAGAGHQGADQPTDRRHRRESREKTPHGMS